MAGKYAGLISSVIERFQRIVNSKVFSAKGSYFVRVPGFKYDDFNRAGLLNIARLNRLAEMSRMNDGKFMSHQEKAVFFLMFGRHWTFHPVLYDRAAVEFPMILRTRISAVGRSSIDLVMTQEDETDGALLASLVFRLVNIEPTTRGSAVPFPDDARAAVLKLVSPNCERFPKVNVPKGVPKDAFSCPIRVRYDDMDFLFHTNQGSYLGFALECAAQAAEAGYYTQIRDDVAFWRARRSTSIHLMESHAGDELDVSTWQNADNQLLLHFAVSKSGQMIYYSEIEYYSK